MRAQDLYFQVLTRAAVNVQPLCLDCKENLLVEGGVFPDETHQSSTGTAGYEVDLHALPARAEFQQGSRCLGLRLPSLAIVGARVR